MFYKVCRKYVAGESRKSDSLSLKLVIQEEIVYARYAKKGEVFVQFLSLQSVAKTNAEHITAAISAAVTLALVVEEEVWKKRLVRVATHGAAVVLGH